MFSLSLVLSLGLLAQEPSSPPVSVETVTPRILTLMREGLDVPSPNTSFTRRMERETIFSGSYDWHSCVIAHWALLVQARETDDADARAWVRKRLAMDDLEYESESLVQREAKHRVTWPYDEAWFLMLLTELGRHPAEGPHDHQRTLALRKLHEKRLLHALETRPFPAEKGSEEGAAPRFVGYYSSWLWTYLLVRWSEPITSRGAARIDALRTSKLLPGRELFDAQTAFEPHPYDFLWMPALFALEDPARVPTYDAGELPAWPQTVTLRDVHILGRELCRVWPLSGQAAYSKRIGDLLEREDLWAGDFTVVSHWIPQFLFIGEWLGKR